MYICIDFLLPNHVISLELIVQEVWEGCNMEPDLGDATTALGCESQTFRGTGGTVGALWLPLWNKSAQKSRKESVAR